MRYFICAIGNVTLAIPAEQTERVIPVERRQTGVYESEDSEAFISIPALFRQTDTAIPHGLVLKNAAAGGNKTTLLTPKIDIDLEIPEEKIHRLPEVFAGVFSLLRGVFFGGDNGGMILILDPVKLRKLVMEVHPAETM